MRTDPSLPPCMLLADVDGTLLDATGRFYLGAETLFQLPGVPLLTGLCSARPLPSLISLAARLHAVDFLAASQGAIVARCVQTAEASSNSGQWEILATSWLSEIELASIRLVSEQFALDAWFHDDRRWYAPRDSETVRREAYLTQVDPTWYVADERIKAIKAVLVAPDRNALVRIPEALNALHRLRLDAAQSRCEYIEVVSAGSSRSKGADVIARFANVARHYLIAVGDSSNDRGMLEFANYSFAFTKSPKELFEIGAVELPDPQNGGLHELSRWITTTFGTTCQS